MAKRMLRKLDLALFPVCPSLALPPLLQLHDNSEPLRPHEAGWPKSGGSKDALRSVEAQMPDVPMPHQLAVPSDSELSSVSPSSDSEQMPALPEGRAADSGSE